jgi:hypothetical protein
VSESKVDTVNVSSCCLKDKSDLQSNTGPIDELGRTDQRDPPIKELDGG